MSPATPPPSDWRQVGREQLRRFLLGVGLSAPVVGVAIAAMVLSDEAQWAQALAALSLFWMIGVFWWLDGRPRGRLFLIAIAVVVGVLIGSRN